MCCQAPDPAVVSDRVASHRDGRGAAAAPPTDFSQSAARLAGAFGNVATSSRPVALRSFRQGIWRLVARYLDELRAGGIGGIQGEREPVGMKRLTSPGADRAVAR